MDRAAFHTAHTPHPGLCNQFVQQRLRVLQIGSVEAFGEPAVDGCQQRARLLALDSPLEEGVLSEPVSESRKFPVSRENTGNFVDLRLASVSAAAKKGIKPEPYGPIPYAPEQGIFCAPCWEFKSAIREISALIRESRSPPLFGRPIRSSREISNGAERAKRDAARSCVAASDL